MKLLVYGEVLFDVYPDAEHIGGAPFNFYAHSSLEGTDACLLTAVGDDDLGNKALEAIKSYNGNTKYVLKNDKHTGMVTVVLDENKVPSYNIHTDTDDDNIVLSDEMISEISNEGFDCLYFGTLIQRNCTSSASLKRFSRSPTTTTPDTADVKPITTMTYRRFPVSCSRKVRPCLSTAPCSMSMNSVIWKWISVSFLIRSAMKHRVITMPV